MLHFKDPIVREYLFEGKFGLEKESLRVDENGNLSHTPHPFPQEAFITRDFCENQVEINTPVAETAEEVVQTLGALHRQVQEGLSTLPRREYIWPFSNAPIIRNEEDIPVALFEGGRASKTEYRNYLSDRYGRYKMTFSGIHFNYSFSEQLFRREAKLQEWGEQNGKGDRHRDTSGNTGREVPGTLEGQAQQREPWESFRDQFYVELAENASAYGWLVTMLTAASPLQDRSFVQQGRPHETYFSGMASVRCSELGYWNFFAPVYDYTDLKHYGLSIQRYVDEGLLASPTELYYPIRLKPRGLNRIDTLCSRGVDHIELRMLDLNPLVPLGIDERDVRFIQLFLIWLASLPALHLDARQQVQAVQNFKSAAHYDLDTVKIILPDGFIGTAQSAGLEVLSRIEYFCRQIGDEEALGLVRFQREKLERPGGRYAEQVLALYSEDYIGQGMKLAQRWQEQVL